jgi:hypothetical protein
MAQLDSNRLERSVLVAIIELPDSFLFRTERQRPHIPKTAQSQ